MKEGVGGRLDKIFSSTPLVSVRTSVFVKHKTVPLDKGGTVPL
jgi:hypothetical protein